MAPVVVPFEIHRPDLPVYELGLWQFKDLAWLRTVFRFRTHPVRFENIRVVLGTSAPGLTVRRRWVVHLLNRHQFHPKKGTYAIQMDSPNRGLRVKDHRSVLITVLNQAESF